ncbi:MAG: DUF4831 family protein [Paludibacter sp.]|nr:DUF4831 family protein [Paludibacter sp.]
MRNIIILSLLLIANLFAGAQSFSLTSGESVLVYSLPKTQFSIEVETEKVTQKPGMFYRYSERYLATTNVITQEKTIYRLKGIKVTAQAVADSTRTYSFVPTKDLQTNHLTVNSKGILCGVNVALNEKTIIKNLIKNTVEESAGSANLLPLGEEYMMAGSEAKLAEGAAKQIYRIRESRMSLLTADVEKMPADGASFKSMLDGMNKMERDLTDLFVGKTITETQTRRISITPAKAMSNEVIFRLSALRGVVATDDLGGDPYFITITPSVIKTVAPDPKAKQGKPALYYILPATTNVSISNGINTVYSEKFEVPQFGVTVPLYDEFFKQAKVKVQIDPQTGRLLSID